MGKKFNRIEKLSKIGLNRLTLKEVLDAEFELHQEELTNIKKKPRS